MNRGTISSDGHYAAQRIHFPHQMAFSNTANRRITAHLTEISSTEGQQRDTSATSRRSTCSFASGVAATDDQNVEHWSPIHGSDAGFNEPMFHVERASQPVREADENRSHRMASRETLSEVIYLDKNA